MSSAWNRWQSEWEVRPRRRQNGTLVQGRRWTADPARGPGNSLSFTTVNPHTYSTRQAPIDRFILHTDEMYANTKRGYETNEVTLNKYPRLGYKGELWYPDAATKKRYDQYMFAYRRTSSRKVFITATHPRISR